MKTCLCFLRVLVASSQVAASFWTALLRLCCVWSVARWPSFSFGACWLALDCGPSVPRPLLLGSVECSNSAFAIQVDRGAGWDDLPLKACVDLGAVRDASPHGEEAPNTRW